MAKSILNWGGYLFIMCLLVSPFFIKEASATQTNCTDGTDDPIFKYRLPVQNITENGSYVDIDYAICNVTIYQKQLNGDNFINSSAMVNNNNGTYDCWIMRDTPTGKYNTFYECNIAGLIAQDHGRFEIVPDSVPLSIILFLVGVAALFIFYAMHLEKKFLAVKALFFLSTFLIYFVILAMLLPLVSEEGANAGIVDLAEMVFVVYSILFIAIVLYTVIMIIIQILAVFTAKKKAKDNIGVKFN